MIVATHTWGNGSRHPKSEFHFYERLDSYPDAVDRAFGVPVCVSHLIKDKELATIETTSDDVRAVVAVHDNPSKNDCCRGCRSVVAVAKFPKSTMGDLQEKTQTNTNTGDSNG